MLDKLILMLGLKGEIDDNMTAKLEHIIDTISQRLCILLNTGIVPAELEYIVVEVAIARYNRIGSEGVDNHTVQGENMHWATDDDFAPYKRDIQAWLDAQEDPSTTKGRLRFI